MFFGYTCIWIPLGEIEKSVALCPNVFTPGNVAIVQGPLGGRRYYVPENLTPPEDLCVMRICIEGIKIGSEAEPHDGPLHRRF